MARYLPSYSTVEQVAQSLPLLRDQVLFLLLLETGCKAGELLKLRNKDITENEISIQKNKTTLSPQTTTLLSTYLSQRTAAPATPLFVGRESKAMTQRRLAQIIRNNTIAKLNKPLSAEDIRMISITNKEEASLKSMKQVCLRHYIAKELCSSILQSIQNKRDQFIWRLLLEGLTPKKICNLRVTDIEKLSNKTLQKDLTTYMQETNASSARFVFLTRQQSHLTKERIFQIIQRIGDTFGITLSPRNVYTSPYAWKLQEHGRNLIERRDGQGIIVYRAVQ